MDGELIIRPARPDDRPAMERICAHTWDWGDYIPEVWDDWLADDQGPVIVGEMAGRMVALSKITFSRPDEVWLEGMRVEPDYRRRGIGVQFLDYSLAYARDHGARVVRLGTAHYNRPVHTMAARTGMVHVGSYVLWVAEPLPGGPRPTFLAVEHTTQVQALLAGSQVLAHSHGLYSAHWAWQELSTERVLRFLETGQIVGQLMPDASLVALATIHVDPQDREMWIGFADGQPEKVRRLATAVRTHAADVGAVNVQVMLPDVPWLRETFRAAGYGPGEWEGELWIFECRLSPTRVAKTAGALTVGHEVMLPVSYPEGGSGGKRGG